ncbi:MAG: hypothetical protein ACKPA7_17590 [Sphaerospermopsis kisseleviana]
MMNYQLSIINYQLSIFITGYFPVRAKHSGEQLSIFITGYFPNASPLLRPYDS